MKKQLTTKGFDGLYYIQRPSPYKKEYHGNGSNAWNGQTEAINGHTVEYRSVRYSYRWHKTQVWFDGRQLRTAQDYKRAEALLNE
jgi:hypothetical protein